MTTDPRYPIGQFVLPADLRAATPEAIAAIAAFPEELSAALEGLSAAEVDTPYREDGWTVRQLVHHVADSHMNANIRIRLALTEDWPKIVTYEEHLWARLLDACTLPVEFSLDLLRPLHYRWASLLQSLDDKEWERGYVHPESGRTSVRHALHLYAWHGRHHVAHITELRKNRGW
jgi:hypothetical protein